MDEFCASVCIELIHMHVLHIRWEKDTTSEAKQSAYLRIISTTRCAWGAIAKRNMVMPGPTAIS